MFSIRPSKRQKLQHSGPISNPIYVSDDKSESEPGDLGSLRPDADSLNHFLSSLDNLNRDDYLATLMGDVKIVESRLDISRAKVEDHSRNPTALQREIWYAKQFSDIVKAGAEGHDSKVPVESSSHEQTPSSPYEKDRQLTVWVFLLGRSSDCCILKGRPCAYARKLGKALSRWADAL
ncbi:uncharacterized protein Z519_06845 [Cladophialophora bantiana CBS 173.52]|uniref:Uncharacterized protein n=1 Tax=Cladophialophora bantiana (strain ATCC 10958 / CBS 173.52 / CDC B-1940 / NIH 8579) TaxID=1442370 RepID=A0A0D2ET09_CLAB1|nr:uncharacterized protein Z519_06845 [Cladophialophora bantiana CBS 173.52]KIW92996.1 hypothetical protein Z519_06845 [Cladophialophora bantiana CBS 173.52]